MTTALTIAADPQTPGKKLMSMIEHTDAAVLDALASNPNLPKKGLLRLLGRRPALVLDNPAMALLRLEDARLFHRAPAELQACWAANPETPAWLLRELTGLRRSEVREALATNRATPLECLEELAFPDQFRGDDEHDDDDDDWVEPQYGVLENPSITEALRFDLLGRIESDDVDRDFVYIPESEEQPLYYGLDPEETGAWCFAVDDEADEIEVPLSRDGSGVHWLPSCDGVVWGSDCERDQDDELVFEWDNEDERSMWGKNWGDLAENPATPSSLLERMLRNDDPAVRAGAAAHPEVSKSQLAALVSDPSFLVQRAAAHNHRTPAEALARLARSESFSVRRMVAANPSTPTSALAALASDRWSGVRMTAQRNLRVMATKEIEKRQAA